MDTQFATLMGWPQRAKPFSLVMINANADGEQCAATLKLLKAHRDGESFFGIFDASNFNQSGDDCWENWLVRARTLRGGRV